MARHLQTMVFTALNEFEKPIDCCWYCCGGAPAKVLIGPMVLMRVDFVMAG